MSTNKKQIIRCEHCGNKTLHNILFTADGPEEILDLPDYPDISGKTYYFLTQCSSCLEISLFTDWDQSEELGNLDMAALLYPIIQKFSNDVPKIITKDYEEAKKVLKISPIAFTVLTRRSLERVCIDQKAIGRTLKEKLDNLAKNGIIPQSLSKMANAIRYLGNIGAHISDEEIDYDEAKILADFFTAIIEYVYIAPAKLDKLSDKLKNKKKQTLKKKLRK